MRAERIAAGFAATTIVLGALAAGPPRVLFNHSPSEPVGAYWRTGSAPAVGSLVAFATPAGAFPYADARMPYLRREPILKAIAAGPGERVCTAGGRLTINGAPRGPIAVRDGQGRALPHWDGCRVLGAGELFVFSDRVPNSFDSRYFGPIPSRSVLGVYRRLGG